MIRYTHLLVDSAALELQGEVGRQVKNISLRCSQGIAPSDFASVCK